MTEKIPPVHPGEVLQEEFLKPWGLSQNKLAQHMNITATRLNEIIRGRRNVTGDTALRLARATNTTPEFWLNLQTLYDLETAKDRLGARLNKEVKPVAMVRSGFKSSP
ncbi:MAG: HigA family addiction module antitoxin [Chloroflexi bacterium]|nr:HigA family addiction module antitoxin [Chloroflexota bacterium]